MTVSNIRTKIDFNYHSLDETILEAGPIEEDKEVVRSEPFTLPDKFYWDDLDLSDNDQVNFILNTI